MNGTAQIIWVSLAGLALVLVALRGVIWAIRCPADSPNYRLPPLRLLWWRES